MEDPVRNLDIADLITMLFLLFCDVHLQKAYLLNFRLVRSSDHVL